ncbi:MAG: SdiA-regulated domain-containing protein [Candidatus Delongbacteria bacterium]
MRRVFLLTAWGLLAFSCYGQAEPAPTWTLLSEVRVQVQEPSGLCLDPLSGQFWTVSDETGLVYRFDPTGRVTRTLAWSGDDLEGICTDPRDGSLWIVGERDGQAVHLSIHGTELGRFTLEPAAGRGNSGLEGIECDARGHLWLLQEKDPGRLYLWEPEGGALEIRELDFARDYSGLALDPERGGCWVVSDESESLTFLGDDGRVLEYALGLERLEGVAVAGDSIWVLSDSNATLFEIQLP